MTPRFPPGQKYNKKKVVEFLYKLKRTKMFLYSVLTCPLLQKPSGVGFL